MNEKQELRERTNPAFNTAEPTLLRLCVTGGEDAKVLAERFGTNVEELMQDEGKKAALGADLTVMAETQYRVANRMLSAYGKGTILDIPCGFNPRAIHEEFRDRHYIGCDLPVVIDELAPVIGEILAERGILKKEFHGADVTNYQSLRDAVASVEGELCITTEGLVTLFNDSELTELCKNVRRLLEEFGGCWITADLEANPLFMAAMTAVHGEAAFENLIKTRDEVSDISDTKIDANNMTVLRYDYEKNLKKVTDFLHSVGLKWERVPMANYLPELGSLAVYPDETKAAYKKELENVYAWILTPDEDYGKSEADYDSASFGVKASMSDKKMKITLRGRLDSITAPELLSVYEKTAAGGTPEKIAVDASALEYISSAGLRVLIMMIKQTGNGNLTVTGQNETVQNILEQTGLADLVG